MAEVSIESSESFNIYIKELGQLLLNISYSLNDKELSRVNRTYDPVFNLHFWRIWG